MIGFKIWIEAARPKTLWASVAPVLIGTAMSYADGKWDPVIMLVTIFSAVMIQVGTNFANDYYDHKSGLGMLVFRLHGFLPKKPVFLKQMCIA